MARRSDHTREEIREMAIQAGIELIEERGFSYCSARKVAAKIGYTVGTLYNVFENYDDLVFQINIRTLDDLRKYVLEHLDPELRGLNAVKRLGALYIEFAHEYSSRWSALFEYHRPPESALPQWYLIKLKSLFAIATKLLLPIVCGDVERAQRASQVLWGGVHGICLLGLTKRLGEDGTESLTALTDSLIENYMKGLTQSEE